MPRVIRTQPTRSLCLLCLLTLLTGCQLFDSLGATEETPDVAKAPDMERDMPKEVTPDMPPEDVPDLVPGCEPVEERCNGVDDDCDGDIDEGCVDVDRDGWCDGAGPEVILSEQGQGPEVCPKGGGDCDDGNTSVYPGAPERCDLVDQSCNGDPGQLTLQDPVIVEPAISAARQISWAPSTTGLTGVAWVEERDSSAMVRFALLNGASGQLRFDTRSISAPTSSALSVDITWHPTLERFAILWSERDPQRGEDSLKMALVDPSGESTPVTPEYVAQTQPGAVRVLADGPHVIAVFDAPPGDIFHAARDATGAWGAPVRLAADRALQDISLQHAPAVGAEDQGRLFLGWVSSNGEAVQAQHFFSVSARSLGALRTVLPFEKPLETQFVRFIAVNGFHWFLFEQLTDLQDPSIVFAQQLDADGRAFGTPKVLLEGVRAFSHYMTYADGDVLWVLYEDFFGTLRFRNILLGASKPATIDENLEWSDAPNFPSHYSSLLTRRLFVQGNNPHLLHVRKEAPFFDVVRWPTPAFPQSSFVTPASMSPPAHLIDVFSQKNDVRALFREGAGGVSLRELTAAGEGRSTSLPPVMTPGRAAQYSFLSDGNVLFSRVSRSYDFAYQDKYGETLECGQTFSLREYSVAEGAWREPDDLSVKGDRCEGRQVNVTPYPIRVGADWVLVNVAGHPIEEPARVEIHNKKGIVNTLWASDQPLQLLGSRYHDGEKLGHMLLHLLDEGKDASRLLYLVFEKEKGSLVSKALVFQGAPGDVFEDMALDALGERAWFALSVLSGGAQGSASVWSGLTTQQPERAVVDSDRPGQRLELLGLEAGGVGARLLTRAIGNVKDEVSLTLLRNAGTYTRAKFDSAPGARVQVTGTPGYHVVVMVDDYKQDVRVFDNDASLLTQAQGAVATDLSASSSVLIPKMLDGAILWLSQHGVYRRALFTSGACE